MACFSPASSRCSSRDCTTAGRTRISTSEAAADRRAARAEWAVPSSRLAWRVHDRRADRAGQADKLDHGVTAGIGLEWHRLPVIHHPDVARRILPLVKFTARPGLPPRYSVTEEPWK